MSGRWKDLTLDELSEVSLALASVMQQKRIVEVLGLDPDRTTINQLTGDHSGFPVYNLHQVWWAAKRDSGNLDTPGQRHYMSPKRFINGWPHLVGATEVNEVGHFMADLGTAFAYCQFIDDRVMSATINQQIQQRKAAAAVDPIGNAVDASRGGPLAMMFARMDARHLGLTDQEFIEAVMDRAKADAAHLDDYAAEALLSRVRQAIEGCPRVETVKVSSHERGEG